MAHDSLPDEGASRPVPSDIKHHDVEIRLQAERVCNAYRELRADANSANFQSGDFPVGLFGELIQQIKLLEGWLEPAEDRLADLKARAAARGYELLPDDSGDKDRYYALDTQLRVLAAEPMTLAGVAEWLDSAEAEDDEPEVDHDALHEQTVAEIRAERPNADEREIKLRTAIRESMTMTRGEENIMTNKIRAALSDEPKVHVLPDSKKLWTIDQARDDAQIAVYRIRALVGAALELNSDDDGRIKEVLLAAREKLMTLANDLDSVNFGKQS